MTYDEFKRRLSVAGLSIKDFAALVKMHPAAVTNYAKSGRVSKWIAIAVTLMAEMADRGVDFRAVLARIDISPAAPRGPDEPTFGRVVTRECVASKEAGDERED